MFGWVGWWDLNYTSEEKRNANAKNNSKPVFGSALNKSSFINLKGSMGSTRKLKGMPRAHSGTKYLAVKGSGSRWHLTKLKKR